MYLLRLRRHIESASWGPEDVTVPTGEATGVSVMNEESRRGALLAGERVCQEGHSAAG
jgi:hypothetical protein